MNKLFFLAIGFLSFGAFSQSNESSGTFKVDAGDRHYIVSVDEYGMVDDVSLSDDSISTDDEGKFTFKFEPVYVKNVLTDEDILVQIKITTTLNGERYIASHNRITGGTLARGVLYVPASIESFETINHYKIDVVLKGEIYAQDDPWYLKMFIDGSGNAFRR